MADINPDDVIWSFSGRTGTKHVGRDSFDGHQTIVPHVDVHRASSRVPSFIRVMIGYQTIHVCSHTEKRPTTD